MRKIVSVVATLAVVGLLSGPASAASSSAPAAAGIATHNVTAQCSLGAGVATSGSKDYVFAGTADAWATNGSVGTATTLTCYIKDRFTGATYASATSSSPGPHAQVGPGTVTLPLNSNPFVCAGASAVFSDAVRASYSDC